MKPKCYFAFDGSCKNDADWICGECGYALCKECADEEWDGTAFNGKCLGKCLNNLSDMVDITILDEN